MRRQLPFPRLCATLLGMTWLAVGPFAGILQGLALCRHHEMTAHAHHGAPAQPTDAPCFCDHMTDTGTATITAPVALLETASQLLPQVSSLVVKVASSVQRPASRVPTPVPPPPIALA